MKKCHELQKPERVIVRLGAGFLQHPKNEEFRQLIAAEQLTAGVYEFLLVTGSDRKITGSYYTPSE